GLSIEHVKALAGLCGLEPEVQQLVRQGRVSGRAALALRPLPPTRQVEVAEKAAQHNWSAEQIRDESGRLGLRRHRPAAAQPGPTVDIPTPRTALKNVDPAGEPSETSLPRFNRLE